MRLPHKLLGLSFVFALVSTGAMGLFGLRLLDRQMEEVSADRLAREAGLFADELAAGGGLDEGRLRDDARRLAGRLGLRVTILAPDGRVVVDSEVAPEAVGRMENHATRPEVAAALASGDGRAKRHSASIDTDLLYVARRFDREGRPAGVVRFALPLRAMAQVEREYRQTLLRVGLLGLLGAAAASLALARRWGRPIAGVRDAAAAIAAGEVDRPIDVSREDEFGDMARAVARMRENLLASIARVEAERRRVESMIGAIEEGVLGVDGRSVVTFANERMRRLFGFPPDAVGRPLVECLRVPEAVTAFREALASGEPVVRTIRPPGGSAGAAAVLELRVVVTASPDAGGGKSAVGLFLDMTRLEALERTRRQFVADVSHELRTPLTSAKAAAETLASSGVVPAELARFPEILRKQLGKLEELVDDLTDLSAIETGAIVLRPEPVDAAALAREVAAEIEAKWSARQVAVTVDERGSATVSADRRRLTQVLTNLVDNAAKFTAEGSAVAVRVGPGPSGVRIEVEDDGPGIAPEHRERVFQRFFQVDPSRSKSLPGTGLGLAIVKHLVALHGGRIEVLPAPGKGSIFRLDWPVG